MTLGLHAFRSWAGLRKERLFLFFVHFGDVPLDFSMKIEKTLQNCGITRGLQHVPEASFNFEQVV